MDVNFRKTGKDTMGSSRKKGIIIGVAVVVALGVGAVGGGYWIGSQKDKDVVAVASNPLISYPEGWQELQLESADAQNSIILKARNTAASSSVVITAVDGGLKEDVKFSELPDSIVANFEKQIANFKLIKKEVIKVGSYDAIAIQYKQQAEGSKVKEQLQVIIPVQGKTQKTYYLNYQSPEDKISEIKDDIATINKSFADYAAARAQ